MDFDEKRKKLLLLWGKCPVCGCTLLSCPLHRIRKNDLESQTLWLKEQTDDEIDSILNYCSTCHTRACQVINNQEVKKIRKKRER
jgi:hypothetical protein